MVTTAFYEGLHAVACGKLEKVLLSRLSMPKIQKMRRKAGTCLSRQQVWFFECYFIWVSAEAAMVALKSKRLAWSRGRELQAMQVMIDSPLLSGRESRLRQRPGGQCQDCWWAGRRRRSPWLLCSAPGSGANVSR